MTPRQAQVFAFIRDRIEGVGAAPILEEIAERFKFSKPRASIIVREIVEQGALKRDHNGTQGLRLPGHVDLTTVGTETLRNELARRGVTMDALETPRVLSGERRCAANHCTEKVRPGQLMCRNHWFELPAHMRSAIMNAWSARHMRAYQEAVEAARDHLGGFTRVLDRVG